MKPTSKAANVPTITACMIGPHVACGAPDSASVLDADGCRDEVSSGLIGFIDVHELQPTVA
jgi:hypothetical protein